MGNVFRCFVEKKSGYDVEAEGLFHELRHTLGLTGLTGCGLLRRSPGRDKGFIQFFIYLLHYVNPLKVAF